MSEIAKRIGNRIRNYRTARGLSQERLAELAGCHPTYVGQIERGEKNATLESVERIASALGVSLSGLFEGIGARDEESDDVALECYELLLSKPRPEQERLRAILFSIDEYKTL